MTDEVGSTRADGQFTDPSDLDPGEPAGATSSTVIAMCTSDLPLAELFPTIAQRRYLTVPVRFLPPRLHPLFGRRPWRWFVSLSPRELAEHDRVDEASLRWVLSALRDEDDLAESLTS